MLQSLVALALLAAAPLAQADHPHLQDRGVQQGYGSCVKPSEERRTTFTATRSGPRMTMTIHESRTVTVTVTRQIPTVYVTVEPEPEKSCRPRTTVTKEVIVEPQPQPQKFEKPEGAMFFKGNNETQTEQETEIAVTKFIDNPAEETSAQHPVNRYCRARPAISAQ